MPRHVVGVIPTGRCHYHESITEVQIALQAGNLIQLRPQGAASQGSSSHGAQGEWEEWPEAEGSGRDDELQRAIAASLADPAQGEWYMMRLSTPLCPHSVRCVMRASTSGFWRSSHQQFLLLQQREATAIAASR